MEKFVPIEKQSKKAQKQHHMQQRNSWNGVNPYSRTFPDKKKFNKAARSKAKAELRTF